jgi:O-antigen/teichoic acid export membrane protein
MVAAAAALLLMPLIVHHLGDRIYGFWSLAGAFIGYYGLLDLGLSSAVSQYLCIAIGRKDTAESRAVFNTALSIQSVLGCIALVATTAIAAATPWFCRNPADAALFWKVIVILGVNAALSFPVRVYGGLLEAELRFDIQSGLEFLGLVLRTGLIICAILAGGGLLALAWTSLLASLPIMVLQVWFARREAPWARIGESSLDWKRTKSFFSYSVYTFVATIADTLRFQVDALVISAFIGLAAVTHYRIASVFAKYYVEALMALVRLFQPILSRLHGASDRGGLEKVFFFATKVTLCASVFICCAVIAWGKSFIACWMGAKYEDAYWPMVVLALAVFLDVCQSPSVGLLYATFEHRYYTYMNSAEGVINLVFSLALARPLGILGVALGTLIGAVVIRIVAQPIIVCRVSGLSYGTYMKFLGGNLLRYGCLMGGTIALSEWGIRPAYFWLVSSGIWATAIYAAGSWLFVFNQGEREHFLDAVTNRGRNQIKMAGVGATV